MSIVKNSLILVVLFFFFLKGHYYRGQGGAVPSETSSFRGYGSEGEGGRAGERGEEVGADEGILEN